MKTIILFVFLLLAMVLDANNTNNLKGIVKDKSNPDYALVGASIYWENTTHGTTSDGEGKFEIAHQTGQHANLVVSFVGYIPDTLHIDGRQANITVLLDKNIELGEVMVSKRRRGQYHPTMNTIQTNIITTTELHRAACCNLSESFETNASVDVSFSDAVTGAKQIKMLGLSGNYVQTLSENMPLIRGLSAPYGLGHVPGPWLETIQISKGTSSIVNGYEAIAGQINIEYKKPCGNEKLHLNLYGNNELKSEANFNYAYQFNDRLSTMILLHGENHNKAVDDNGDSFLDMPHIKQINFINRWKYRSDDGGHKEIGVQVLDEHIQTGQVGAFDDPAANLYGIDILTRRYQMFLKNGIMFSKPGTSLGIQASASYHSHDSKYGNRMYTADQYNAYLNVIYMGNFGTDLHTYKTGASFMADRYNQMLENNGANFDEFVPGIFAEYNYDLRNKLNIIAGVRADYSSYHGLFLTPRVHARWNINNWLVWRMSAGKGYRTALPLAESNYLLASSRQIIIDQNLKQEEAFNAGISITAKFHVGDRDLTLMVDYYHTNFINQVVSDVDSDVHSVRFSNLDGLSYSNAAQAEVFFELFDGLTLNAAYRLNHVKQTINGQLRQLPLTSKYKGLVSLSYSTRLNKWQFDLTSQFNGGGRMPDPSPTNPIWEATFDPFTIFHAQITKNYKRWGFYLGSENLAGFKMHNPIIGANDPWGNNFDGSMIWGPVHGRKIYVGLRYTI